MLASDVVAHLGSQPGYQAVALPHSLLDVTRAEDVDAALAHHQPAVVINTAALHVDDCEAHPEKAFAINSWGARSVAQACERHRAILVHISSGGLFGNEVRPYHEYDLVVLQTIYARSKYAGEEYVRHFCERYFILRLGWLYGGSVSQRKNFILARYLEAIKKPLVQSAGDKHGSPTYTGDAASAIESLLDSEQYGLYHIANQGGCTRAEYVRAILRGFGLATVVETVDSTYFPRKARVPDCEILSSLNLEYAGLPLLPPWEESLARYIHSIRDEVS